MLNSLNFPKLRTTALEAVPFLKNHVVAGQLCCLCLNHPGFDFYSRAHDCFEQYRYALSIV